MIKRHLEKSIKKMLNAKKVLILLGARQVGKTTLLKELFEREKDVEWLSGDEQSTNEFFKDVSAIRLKNYFKGKKILVIDEAQNIENIGTKLKLMADNIENLQVIATGSSAFEIANKTNEPLTGRKWEYKMYPLSFSEMAKNNGLLNEKNMLPHRLVYGYYPEIVSNPGKEKEILKQLSDSYLYKDILKWEGIQKPDKLLKLLQALAYQIGSQVSFSELGQIVSLDSKTVEKYIVLLEQCFVIFRLNSFSGNLRNELKNSKKIYFYDLGIRNALIANFSDVSIRQDIGAMWENFVISERKKKLEYDGIWKNCWFWRTKQQQEIDYLEEGDGRLNGYEIKWSPKVKVKSKDFFLTNYKNSSFEVIDRSNVEDFLV
jgi:predicted AAA+ superfamily ATPase